MTHERPKPPGLETGMTVGIPVLYNLPVGHGRSLTAPPLGAHTRLGVGLGVV